MAKAEYRSAIRSKRLIVEALAEVLQEKPLDKITVTDVVARAEINRGTFYAHYADIPDVINHLIHSTFSKIEDVLRIEPSRLHQLPEALLGYIRDMLAEDMDFYTKVMASSAAPVLQEQLVKTVVEYLLQHEQDYGFGNHEKYVLTIRFCAGGLSSLYRDWFDGKLDMSLDELTVNAQKMLTGVMAMN
jgi:AcrR family transcriptional regulator